MPIITTLLAIAQVSPSLVSSGTKYIALPGTPAMVDARGKTIDPLRSMFHELTFVRQEEDGTRRFLLDRSVALSTKASDPFQKDGLRPLAESDLLARLRRRYVGRRVWSYGGLNAFREALRPRVSAFSSVAPGHGLRIKAVYQIARVPIAFSLASDSDKGQRLVGAYEPEGYEGQWGDFKPFGYGAESAFLVVYELPDRRLSSWSGNERWTKEANRRAADPRSYGAPYNVFVGAWRFERTFSLAPPSAAARRAIRRSESRLREGTDDPYQGLSHRQAAWALGWPMERASLAHTLRRTDWNYGDQYFLGFRGDRVVSYGRSMPH